MIKQSFSEDLWTDVSFDAFRRATISSLVSFRLGGPFGGPAGANSVDGCLCAVFGVVPPRACWVSWFKAIWLGRLGGREPGGSNVADALEGGIGAPPPSIGSALPFMYGSQVFPSPGGCGIGLPGPPLGRCCFGSVPPDSYICLSPSLKGNDQISDCEN